MYRKLPSTPSPRVWYGVLPRESGCEESVLSNADLDRAVAGLPLAEPRRKMNIEEQSLSEKPLAMNTARNREKDTRWNSLYLPVSWLAGSSCKSGCYPVSE